MGVHRSACVVLMYDDEPFSKAIGWREQVVVANAEYARRSACRFVHAAGLPRSFSWMFSAQRPYVPHWHKVAAVLNVLKETAANTTLLFVDSDAVVLHSAAPSEMFAALQSQVLPPRAEPVSLLLAEEAGNRGRPMFWWEGDEFLSFKSGQRVNTGVQLWRAGPEALALAKLWLHSAGRECPDELRFRWPYDQGCMEILMGLKPPKQRLKQPIGEQPVGLVPLEAHFQSPFGRWVSHMWGAPDGEFLRSILPAWQLTRLDVDEEHAAGIIQSVERAHAAAAPSLQVATESVMLLKVRMRCWKLHPLTHAPYRKSALARAVIASRWSWGRARAGMRFEVNEVSAGEFSLTFGLLSWGEADGSWGVDRSREDVVHAEFGGQQHMLLFSQCHGVPQFVSTRCNDGTIMRGARLDMANASNVWRNMSGLQARCDRYVSAPLQDAEPARMHVPCCARCSTSCSKACKPPTNGTKPVFVASGRRAGTTLCTLAVRSGLCTPLPGQGRTWDGASSFSKSCHPQWGDRDVASGYLGGASLIRYAERLQLGFFESEFAVPASMPWSSFDVIALVADPWQLTLTLCRGDKKDRFSRLVSGLGRCMASEEMRNFQVHRYSGCALRSWKKCRQARTSTSASAMTDHHLQRALDFIKKAKTVIVTERLAEAGRLLADKFGWQFTDVQEVLRSGTTHDALSGITAGVSGKLEARIVSEDPMAAEIVRNGTALDRTLHAHALQRFERDLSAVPGGRRDGQRVERVKRRGQ